MEPDAEMDCESPTAEPLPFYLPPDKDFPGIDPVPGSKNPAQAGYFSGFFEIAGGEPHYNVVDFGATPWMDDEAVDDQPAIQAAIDHAIANGVGAVFLPRGTYNLWAPISVTFPDPRSRAKSKALRLVGGDALLKMNGPRTVGAMLSVTDARYVSVEGLILNANQRALVAVRAQRLAPGAAFDHVVVHCALKAGWEVVNSTGLSFRRCAANDCGGDGWSIHGASACVLDACKTVGNDGHGVKVWPAGALTAAACTLRGLESSGNGLDGVNVGPASSATGTAHPASHVPTMLVGSYIDNNKRDAVRISAAGVSVLNNRLLGYSTGRADPLTRCLRLDVGATGCNIQGNDAGSPQGAPLFTEITVFGPNFDSHFINGNFKLPGGQPSGPLVVRVRETNKTYRGLPTEYGAGQKSLGVDE